VGARIEFGAVPVDVVRFDEALDVVEALVDRRAGGAVFTPNVDHVVKAERVPELREAYRAADLSVADGMPLVWASRLLGARLPERIAGSDLVLPLARRAARRGWRVYLLGGADGDAARAGAVLGRLGVALAGVEAPRVDLDGSGAAASAAIAGRIRASRADLVLVALGAPKQELWIHRHRGQLGGAVAIGVGASLAFLAGTLPRCPRWMSRAGLEWLFRLASEPRRLWRRYLVEGPAFLPILLRTWRGRAARRAGLPGGAAPHRADAAQGAGSAAPPYVHRQ
jgi:N-acetylglucosaminyldiphosphoundecaprenol N-acetyl-beta-D-mannosaminyltransferase